MAEESTEYARALQKHISLYNKMQIAGARSAEQSGIIGVKTPFDPNIIR